MSEPRRWWIEDNDANTTIPAERAKHRYVEVVPASDYDALKARIAEAEAAINTVVRRYEEAIARNPDASFLYKGCTHGTFTVLKDYLEKHKGEK